MTIEEEYGFPEPNTLVTESPKEPQAIELGPALPSIVRSFTTLGSQLLDNSLVFQKTYLMFCAL